MVSGVHPALDPERIERLAAALGREGTDGQQPAPAPASAPGPAAGGLSARARQTAKRAVRKAIAWYVDDVAQDTADRAVEKLAGQLRERDETPFLKVNQELLKGEVRALLRTVEELGMAIAPATGIEGAAARMAELREGLHALERRLRLMASAPTPTAGAAPAAAPASAPPAAPEDLSRFDYPAFERRFRGDPDVVLADLKARYYDLLAPRAPVLDLGCGKGELLTVLSEAGIDGEGVDNDPAMVAEAADRGVTVHLGDAVAYLEALPEASLGAVVAIQVLEHLPFGAVLALIDLARSRLRPGGVFVAETPNPASLVVLGNSYILDPTHVRPLHPSLLAFLCENAGFRDVRLEFWAPAEGYHLSPVDAPDAPPWVEQVNAAFARLNQVLFGPQDYAVVATTPPAPAS
jgi:SAM-dependent methyltransferase